MNMKIPIYILFDFTDCCAHWWCSRGSTSVYFNLLSCILFLTARYALEYHMIPCPWGVPVLCTESEGSGFEGESNRRQRAARRPTIHSSCITHRCRHTSCAYLCQSHTRVRTTWRVTGANISGLSGAQQLEFIQTIRIVFWYWEGGR